jgi:hypothetical protein
MNIPQSSKNCISNGTSLFVPNNFIDQAFINCLSPLNVNESKVRTAAADLNKLTVQTPIDMSQHIFRTTIDSSGFPVVLSAVGRTVDEQNSGLGHDGQRVSDRIESQLRDPEFSDENRFDVGPGFAVQDENVTVGRSNDNDDSVRMKIGRKRFRFGRNFPIDFLFPPFRYRAVVAARHKHLENKWNSVHMNKITISNPLVVEIPSLEILVSMCEVIFYG